MPLDRESYFTGPSLDRQLLIWALATRHQLERWESLIAARVRADFNYKGSTPWTDWRTWEAATEHHFLLIAARNLIRALDLPGVGISVDETIRAELIEGRDLHEHWVENAPVFNVDPRGQPRHRSGQDYAERNPKPSNYPYWWLGWNDQDGPIVLPNVPARAIHELVDRVAETVVSRSPTMARFVPSPAESPWLGNDAGRDRWWPRPLDAG